MADDVDYVEEACREIEGLRNALRAAQDKLAIFQAHRDPGDPTRLAGMEYTALMRMIDDILSPPYPQ